MEGGPITDPDGVAAPLEIHEALEQGEAFGAWVLGYQLAAGECEGDHRISGS
jgi:hypothetical protein